jgi:hypothetical protein
MKSNLNFLRIWLAVGLIILTSVAHAQFLYTTSNGAITITSYTGSGGDVIIPDKINNLPVIGIGTNAFLSNNVASVTISTNVIFIEDQAFESCTNLTNVFFGNGLASIGIGAFEFDGLLGNFTLPNSLTDISDSAFADCESLTSVVIPNSVTSMGDYVFFGCNNLANVTLGTGITSIGIESFYANVSLINITIPANIASINDFAFAYCISCVGFYFQGNAPRLGQDVFVDVNSAAKVYYPAGTSGWRATYGGLPTVSLNPMLQLGGVMIINNLFSFTVNGANNQAFVIQACTNLASPNWQPIQTNTLNGSTFNFTDPNWTNYSYRFYRAVP